MCVICDPDVVTVAKTTACDVIQGYFRYKCRYYLTPDASNQRIQPQQNQSELQEKFKQSKY